MHLMARPDIDALAREPRCQPDTSPRSTGLCVVRVEYRHQMITIATENAVLRAPTGPYRSDSFSAERRLSEVVPVYAVPDQGVCGVDMSPNSVHAVAA